jgi:hypothetical protein
MKEGEERKEGVRSWLSRRGRRRLLGLLPSLILRKGRRGRSEEANRCARTGRAESPRSEGRLFEVVRGRVRGFKSTMAVGRPRETSRSCVVSTVREKKVVQTRRSSFSFPSLLPIFPSRMHPLPLPSSHRAARREGKERQDERYFILPSHLPAYATSTDQNPPRLQSPALPTCPSCCAVCGSRRL